MVALLATCISAFADDGISFSPNPVEIAANDHVTLSVLFNGEAAYKGFQFEFTMPEGITVELNAKGKLVYTKGDLIEGFNLSGSHTKTGTDRFIAASLEGESFTGEGTLMTVSFVSAEGLADGTYKVKVSGIKFTTEEGKGITLPDMEFDVNVKGTTKIEKAITISKMNGAYNLAGQPLSSLQKGINIVDGKKVWVK